MIHTWARSADHRGDRFVAIIRAGEQVVYRLTKVGTYYHLYRNEIHSQVFNAFRDAREWLTDLQQ